MKQFLVLIMALVVLGCNNKSSETSVVTAETLEIKRPSDFYPAQRTKVLVVGTFHFNYPGLDSHKTSEANQIDVLLEPKKSEVTELVEYIKTFRPNKIAIEAWPRWKAMEKFREYQQGGHRDKRGERYQLAMRLAHELNLDTLYSVDASSLRNDLYQQDSILLNKMLEKINWEAEDPFWPMSEQWMEYDDQLAKEMPLLDYFKLMNGREAHNANYGLYLTGALRTGEGQGADFLSIWWYNRNVRIFSKIINITESPEDRILVLMGNGHAAVLRQLFEASPQFEYVEFASLGEEIINY